MEFYEGKEKMVAAADCHNASFGWHLDCGGPKLLAVAFYICFVLIQNQIILISLLFQVALLFNNEKPSPNRIFSAPDWQAIAEVLLNQI